MVRADEYPETQNGTQKVRAIFTKLVPDTAAPCKSSNWLMVTRIGPTTKATRTERRTVCR